MLVNGLLLPLSLQLLEDGNQLASRLISKVQRTQTSKKHNAADFKLFVFLRALHVLATYLEPHVVEHSHSRNSIRLVEI